MSQNWDWAKLMKDWNQAILKSSLRDSIPPDLIEKGWLGHPGATEEDLEQLEKRLGYRLPPSYRSFLAFTNGWEGRLTHAIYHMWSVDSIDWFSRRNQDWIDGFIDGWTSDDPDEELPPHIEHIKSVLEISERANSAILLMNPSVINKNGEWDAWFFANWMPGAQRYHSFGELMHNQYEGFLELENQQNAKLIVPSPSPKHGTQ